MLNICKEKLSIRNADIKDLEAIAELEKQCFPREEMATEESLRERLTVFPNHFWLLEYEGKLLGMINGMVSDEPVISDEMFEDAGLHNEDGKWQMIFGVDTLPEYRKQGLAAMVMERVIDDVRRQGRKGLVLTCKDKLLHYYAKFGFVNEGISASVHGGVVWYDMRLTFRKR